MGKQLTFQLYHRKMCKYEFLAGEDILPEKALLKNVIQAKVLNIHH